MILINLFCFLKKMFIYMNTYSWERFDETSLLNKEDFYSSLNIEGVTDVDHRHAKKCLKNLKLII